jgi:hypothetical protein
MSEGERPGDGGDNKFTWGPGDLEVETPGGDDADDDDTGDGTDDDTDGGGDD